MLVELGVHPRRIVMASPEPPGPHFLKDPIVTKKLEALLESLEVKPLMRHLAIKSFESDDAGALVSVQLQHIGSSETQVTPGGLEVHCSMLVLCHDKDIDPCLLSGT